MKSISSLLALLFGLVPLAAWAQPSSAQEFIDAYRTAMQEKSVEKLDALTYTAGQSDSDKKQIASMEQMLFSTNPREIGEVTLGPLPPDFQSIYIVNGRKIELTHSPSGMINVQYKGAANGPVSSSSPYAIIDGHYFIVSSKSTDLAWKGPPDTGLCLLVINPGPAGKIQIALKWNASGVEQERIFNSASATVPGQYVESATVTGANPGATLTIMQGSNQIFGSPPLKGNGTIDYRKN